MTKKKSQASSNIKVADAVGFLLALIYMQSVLTVAHHTSHFVHDGSSYTVGPPAVPALVAGLLVVAYSASKTKMKLSTIGIISLTIFATASLFWLSGLRTNFYF